jgi:hypothetical protein
MEVIFPREALEPGSRAADLTEASLGAISESSLFQRSPIRRVPLNHPLPREWLPRL